MAQRIRGSAILLAALMLFSTAAVPFIQFDEQSNPNTLTEEAPVIGVRGQGVQILLMGNSYTQNNNLDSLVEAAFQQDDPNSNGAKLASGGLRLDQHASRSQTAGHQWNTTLNSGNWDWVVLQDQSQVPSFPPSSSQYWEDSKNGAIVLNSMIEANTGETVFLMTWGYRNGDSNNQWRNPDYLTMQGNLDSGYRLYAENVSTPTRPAFVAPAGLAFKHIYNEIVAQGGTPEDSGTLFSDLYSSDGAHPSLSGSYLTTCVIYATISGSDPVGLTAPSGLSAARILALQEAASATVFNETPTIYYPFMRTPSQTFSNGNSSIDLHPSLNESAGLTHRPGQRVTDAGFDVTASGVLDWHNSSTGMLTIAPNATFDLTTVDANGDARLNVSSGGAVPNAGINNTQIHLNSLWQGGNYSFDTLRIVCIGLSCGSISVTGGPLRIYANTIIIDQGAGIYADELVWANAGQGTGTARGTNGKSPGAGGGGHGGSGGAGGGTNGGSGGINYGNGSEAGSSGGNVTFTNINSQTNNDASGGRGGGVVELVARTIYMNGTISVNGGRGDDGAAPPSGTGAGGSGAGGASGGSISLMANTVYTGSNSILRANGGDGGDGARGAQGGVGIGMYDGGNGGGGGGGGVVLVATVAGQFSNNGVMEANAGSGGARGAPYGTGSYGTAGVNGNIGFAFSGTFAGWSGGSIVYADSGTLLSPTFGELGVLHLDSTISVNYTQPLNTTIEGMVRTTVDGTTWSEWKPMNFTQHLLPPLALLQFQLNFSTSDNSTTPTASQFNFNTSSWQSLEDVTLDLGTTHGSNPVFEFNGSLGVARDAFDNAMVGYTDIQIQVPTNVTPISTGWIHVMPPPQFIFEGNVTFALEGTDFATLNTSLFPDSGFTIQLPQSLLVSSWPNTSSSSGSGVVDWANLVLRCSTAVPYMGSFSASLVAIPYEVTARVGSNQTLLKAMNEYVNVTSNRWAEADFSEFPILSGGDGLDSHSITLHNPYVTFIDDIIPEPSNITFLVDGQETIDARIGDIVEIRVKVLGNESDLTIDWHLQGLGGISSWPPPQLGGQPMYWDSLQNAYIALYDTRQHPADFGDRMALWLWLTDSNSNDNFPTGVGGWDDSFTLRPIFPELNRANLTGCDQLLVAVCEARPGSELHLEATAVEGRSDLDVFVHFVQGGVEEVVVPLQWHEASKVYFGDYTFYAADLGNWTVTWRALDLGRNENNFSVEAVSQVRVLDSDYPIENSLSVNTDVAAGDLWELSAEWQQSEYENTSAWVDVSGPNNFSHRENLSTDSSLDLVNISSYVALGSTVVRGAGASESNNSSTGLIHQYLQEDWPHVTLLNISSGYATVVNFRSDVQTISDANPDIITILPLDDYAFTSPSAWQSNYPAFFDQLGGMGAEVYIGSIQLDPDYTCHIGSGPAGCHTFGGYESVKSKNTILKQIVSTRPWVTIVPLSDNGPLHPEWTDTNDDLTDAGHAAVSDAFIREIEARNSLRTLTQSGSGIINITDWPPGDYNFELRVEDDAGNPAIDVQVGPDATYFYPPEDDILSVRILTPIPAALHPGEWQITYNAVCDLNCAMVLAVELDGVLVDTVLSNGGAGTFTLTGLTLGPHQLRVQLSAPDWDVSEPSATLEFVVTPAPKPEWSLQCITYQVESTQESVSVNSQIGRLSRTAHFIDCIVSNSGDASGSIQFSNDSTFGPFSCSRAQHLIDVSGAKTFPCWVEETEENAGIFEVQLIFEMVTNDGVESIGDWKSTMVLITPRFELDVPAGELEDPDEPTPTEVAGQTPLGWIVSAILAIIIGIAAITAIFALRDRRDPYEQAGHKDSLFDDIPELAETDSDPILHPSLTPVPEPPAIPPEPEKPEIEGFRNQSPDPIGLGDSGPSSEVGDSGSDSLVDDSDSQGLTGDKESIEGLGDSGSSSQVGSHEGLPGGGEYGKEDGVTVYIEKDGTQWKMNDAGGFEKAA